MDALQARGDVVARAVGAIRETRTATGSRKICFELIVHCMQHPANYHSTREAGRNVHELLCRKH